MSQVGKFLLGGIQFRRNFLGANTLKTSAWGVFECSVKVIPLFLIIGYAGMNNSSNKLFAGQSYSQPSPIKPLVEGEV